MEKFERDTSQLDGAFHAWANPTDEDYETSGDYPFVFDSPDFRVHQDLEIPKFQEIQLTASASMGFQIFETAEDFDSSQDDELKYSSNFFVPTGLFNTDENDEQDNSIPPQAHAQFAGEIKEFSIKTNEFTGEKFYWFLAETFGGEIDVVADVNLIKTEPKIGGILTGSFWLSGKLLSQ